MTDFEKENLGRSDADGTEAFVPAFGEDAAQEQTSTDAAMESETPQETPVAASPDEHVREREAEQIGTAVPEDTAAKAESEQPMPTARPTGTAYGQEPVASEVPGRADGTTGFGGPQPPAGMASGRLAGEQARHQQHATVPFPSARPGASEATRPLSSSPASSAGTGNGASGDKEPKEKPKWPLAVGGAAVGAIVAGLAVAAALGGMPAGMTNGGGSSAPKVEHVEKGAPEVSRPAELDRSGDATLASAVAERCLPSVVSIQVMSGGSAGQASGVVIDDAGHVLTNSHVVKDMDSIVIVTPDGEEYEAKLVGLDDSSDLAVVSVDWKGATVTPIEWGKSGDLKVGDWVMTIGSPYGLDQSVSAGIVSALSRNEVMESYDGYRLYANLIQTDAAINTGNSGGALVDDEGKLVGINAMLVSASGSFSGIGFAIPSDYAKHVSDQIIAGKDVTHAYIGGKFSDLRQQSNIFNPMSQGDLYGNGYDRNGHVRQQPDNSEAKDGQDANVTQGAVVAEVVKDGPADKAGLQKGDIVTRIGDDKITSATSLVITVRSHEIGDKVNVEYVRDGKVGHAEVTLGSDEGVNMSADQDTSDPGATVQDNGKVERNNQGQGYGSPYGGYDQDQMREFMEFFNQFNQM